MNVAQNLMALFPVRARQNQGITEFHNASANSQRHNVIAIWTKITDQQDHVLTFDYTEL